MNLIIKLFTVKCAELFAQAISKEMSTLLMLIEDVYVT